MRWWGNGCQAFWSARGRRVTWWTVTSATPQRTASSSCMGQGMFRLYYVCLSLVYWCTQSWTLYCRDLYSTMYVVQRTASSLCVGQCVFRFLYTTMYVCCVMRASVHSTVLFTVCGSGYSFYCTMYVCCVVCTQDCTLYCMWASVCLLVCQSITDPLSLFAAQASAGLSHS